MNPEILQLEQCAVRAWPAPTVVELDGWLLRSMADVTRRANSVWAGPTRGELSQDARVEAVERFYRDRGQRSVFQLTPLTDPALDEALARRGYVLDAPVAVETADAARLAAMDLGPAEIQSVISDDWFEISGRNSRFASVEATYRGLLDRIGERGLYGLMRVDERPAAAALGVWDGEYCGIFSMLTLPAYRRRGLARALVIAFARAAIEQGAHTLYLQVERDNENARALYKKLGFEELYGYHYRLKE